MGRLTDFVKGWMNAQGIKEPQTYESLEGNYGSYGFFAHRDGEHYEVHVDCHETSEVLNVYLYAANRVPKKYRMAVAELIARINMRDIQLGNLDIDLDAGVVRYRVGCSLEGLKLSGATLNGMIGEAVANLDRWCPSIQALVNGGLDAKSVFAFICNVDKIVRGHLVTMH